MDLEPYHLLDRLWTRAHFPWTARFEPGRLGPVMAVRMSRLYGGQEMLGVHCYAVGDTLVDTGLACYAPQMLEFCLAHGIRRALVTHHHEDHAGNAATLRDAGLEVLSSPPCGEILRHDLPIRFYEHLVWGKMRVADTTPLATTVRLGPYFAQVIPAPGHCHDQVVFYVPEEGWLFSGDAFIHERVKVFRRDEDFAATLVTLAHLLSLDFDALFCAHRPRPTGGKAALKQKYDWLCEIDGRVRLLHGQGRSPREIAHALEMDIARPVARFFTWLTIGDATPENVVRSILSGPRLRPEIARHLQAA